MQPETNFAAATENASLCMAASFSSMVSPGWQRMDAFETALDDIAVDPDLTNTEVLVESLGRANIGSPV